MRASLISWGGLIGLALLADPGLAGQPFRVDATRQPHAWTLFHGNNPVLVYAFAPAQYKPYVKELRTVRGDNVLRDAPSDHLHHHALMYAIRVNGLNFWEEISGSGVQKPVASPPPEVGTAATGQPQATIRQTLHWLAPQDAFLPDRATLALLVEQRTLVLTVDEAQGEVALHWRSEFEVGGKTNTVTLTGSNYNGLGLRFAQALDLVAEHLNAGGKPDLSGTRQDVSAHPWASVGFDAPGQPATLVLYGHPLNARGDSRFFTMKRAFPYLAATQGLDQEPLVYRTGDRFKLDFLITLYPEKRSVEAIEKRGQAWRSASP